LEPVGFEADLCRAIAAFVFRTIDISADHVQFRYIDGNDENLNDRFTLLKDGTVDVSAHATHTLEREIFEQDHRMGFQFSTPYLWSGVQFSGTRECLPVFLEAVELINSPFFPDTNETCKEKLGRASDDCRETLRNSCGANDASNSNYELNERIKFECGVDPLGGERVKGFVNGYCGILSTEPYISAPIIVKEEFNKAGETFDYAVDSRFFSKDPIALVTRNNETEWSQLVDLVVKGLIAAAKFNITGIVANQILEKRYHTDSPPSLDDDKADANDIFYAIVAVGNYNELYKKHMEQLKIPGWKERTGTINEGGEGRIYSYPLGRELHFASYTGQLRKKSIRCGFVSQPGLADGRDETEFSGIIKDYFDGIQKAGNFTLTFAQPFENRSAAIAALQAGDVDLIGSSAINPSTFPDVVSSVPILYDRMTVAGTTDEIVSCALQKMNGEILLNETCSNLKLCVQQDTAFEDIVLVRLEQEDVDSSSLTVGSLFEKFNNGACQAVVAGAIDIEKFEESSTIFKSVKTQSTISYSLVTRNSQDDVIFSTFVQWIVHSSFLAEELLVGNKTTPEDFSLLTQQHAALFGDDYRYAFKDFFDRVGHHGDILGRHVKNASEISKLNTLSDAEGNGPQHYVEYWWEELFKL